jgi:hypothetical protein
MPISFMTLVGNFIFAQVLIVFLVVSSLLFFAQLFGLPTAWLAWTLEWLTGWWDFCLRQGSDRWLLGFISPSFLFLFIVPVGTVLILRVKWINSASRRILVLTGLCCVTLVYLAFVPKIIQPVSVAINLQDKLKITKAASGGLLLVDNGFFNRKSSVAKFVDFEFKQYITKQYGTINIQELLIQKPGCRSFQAASALCNSFKVERVVLPWFEKKLSKSAWRQFFELKRLLEQKKIQFVRG